MSLKKEIMAALKAEWAVVKINGISRLTRYQKDALGKDVDKMMIDFDYITGAKGGWSCPIKARDYDGILEEIGNATKEYLEMVAEQAIKNMKAGYR